MTTHTARMMGTLDGPTLRGWTDVQLREKADAIEAGTPDGFYSISDEADLRLINAEQARRDAASEQPALWFLATIDRRVCDPDVRHVLVQARSGADVEDALRRHGYDNGRVRWTPLADLRDGVIGQLAVITDGAR